MILAVIPARFASTRFPGKPLAMIGDRTMIQRVYEQVQKAACVDRIVVATDDERIFEHVLSFGGAVMMTQPEHPSGTDRCAEVARQIPEANFVLNIQGDEPFIQPEQIELLANTLLQSTSGIATLAKKITEMTALSNPNLVKAVISLQQEALYFSRQAVPYIRGAELTNWLERGLHYKHIGLYGFRRDTLMELTALAPTPLEMAESLEQLRWVKHGYRIQVGITELETVGIDTPEDLANALTVQ